jgi:hypothetical protein
MRTFHLDLPLCLEASNCSSLHLSRSFNNMYGRHSMFDQLWDFFPKHRYRKTAATVWTMWIPVWTSSSIRQVAHSRFRRPDDGIHGSDARASYMEIAFIWFTAGRQMSWSGLAKPWYGNWVQLKYDRLDDKETPFRCSSIQERISVKFGKPIAQWSVRTPYAYRLDGA